MKPSVTSYILRVYRLDRKKPDSLVGLVEEVESREKKAFTSLTELWEILSRPGRGTMVGKKGRTAKPASIPHIEQVKP